MHRCHLLRTSIALYIILVVFSSCRKDVDATKEKNHGHLKQAKTYEANVLADWCSFNIRLFRKNSFITSFLLSRWWQYSGAAIYEAVAPGMPSYQSLDGQLNNMPALPKPEVGKAYHWGAAANTVFAAMTRYYYTSLPAADKAATDSLENAYALRLSAEVDSNTLQRSVAWGKAMAEAIYQWSLTDGFLDVNPPYVLPTGPGKWVPTAPGFLPPAIPYAGNHRPMMRGSIEASQPPAPVAYSTLPGSPFYEMQKELYDASQNLTQDQKEQAVFWRDLPGAGAFGHWFTIMTQVMRESMPLLRLDKAVLIFTKMGITQADGRISNWKSKYTHNMLRPITYIRTVMENPAWNSFIPTPNNPDYPSAAACYSAAAADVLTEELGEAYGFTDSTYTFIGLPLREYSSFGAAAEEAAVSRLYAGIHVRPSTTAGLWQGHALFNYMKANIKFKK